MNNKERMNKKEQLLELNNIFKEICGLSIFDNYFFSQNIIIEFYISDLQKTNSFKHFMNFLSANNVMIREDWVNMHLKVEINIVDEAVKIFEPEDWHKGWDEVVWLKGKYFNEIFPALKEHIENLIDRKYNDFVNDFEIKNKKILQLMKNKTQQENKDFIKENDNDLLAL